jgi:copper homeostasis protein (lipoprotein)
MIKTVARLGIVAFCLTPSCLPLLAVDPKQSTAATPTAGTVSAAVSIVPPVTYSGVLPCVACAGRRFTLSLRPDGLFLLRQVYLNKGKGENKTLIEQGTWELSEEGSRLSLWGGIELHRQFAVRNGNTLRMLDDRGRENQSTLNYDLARSETFDPIAEPFRKRWMYVRDSGGGFAIDCIKGLRFPVAREGDMAALDAAYETAHPPENAPQVVEFEGHFARRSKSQSSGEEEEDVVVVDKFLLTHSGEGCSGSLPVGGLENTYWKLVELSGAAVATVPGEQEPHLRLESVLRKVTVSGGCNSFRGGYQRSQGTLHFTQLAGTRKACPEPVMERESALMQALAATTTFRLFNQALELYGQGRRLARFERREGRK